MIIRKHKLTFNNYPMFKSDQTKQDFLDIFYITEGNINSHTNLKVWGVLTENEKKIISQGLLAKTYRTTNETKQKIVDLLKLRDALSFRKELFSKKIPNIMEAETRTVGLGLEFFLRDQLERLNSNVMYEKGGIQLDNFYSTDIIAVMKLGRTYNRIGIDFSLSKNMKAISGKWENIQEKHYAENREEVDDYSKRRLPDRLSVFAIDSNLVQIGGNSFQDAVNNFYKNGAPNGGPSEFLNEKDQKHIQRIAKILNFMLNNIHLEKSETLKHEGESIYFEKYTKTKGFSTGDGSIKFNIVN